MGFWLRDFYIDFFVFQTYLHQERQEFKRNIQQDLAHNRIDVYPLAKYDHPDDYGVNESYRVTILSFDCYVVVSC